MEEIPPELILNWDQTGIKIVPSSGWTMDQQGVKRVEVIGMNDKRQITAVFCASMVGDFLPIQLIYAGKTNRCHPQFQFPSDWHITHAPKHWSNEETMLQYIDHIIVPYVENIRDLNNKDTPALVIFDNFKGQITSSVSKLLEQNNIHVCLLPPNTTDLLQPLDISVNKPAKDFLKRKFELWYSERVLEQIQGQDIETLELNPVDLRFPMMREHIAVWLEDMFEYIRENPQFITNGFIRAALDGLDLDKDESEEDRCDETDSELESKED